jgi:UDP-glucose 4-epimerase
MVMRIAVSGGLGYVGGRLSKYLAEQGHEVFALSRQAGALSSIKFPANLKVLHPEVMLSDVTKLKGIDVFIHLAAMNENDCVKFPYQAIDVNIAQTLRWLDLAYSAGVNRFIYFSTAHVYGKPLVGFYDELAPVFPVHPYAITHQCAEDYVLAYHLEKRMDNLVIRLTNSFGPPAFPTVDRWTLLVNDLSRSVVKTGKMILSSDGLQMRDFICLEDVCMGLNHLMQQSASMATNPVYNLGSGRSMSVWDMALRIKNTAEDFLKCPVDLIRKEPSHNPEINLLEISNRKLCDTGFTLANNIDQEIRSTLRFFKLHAV